MINKNYYPTPDDAIDKMIKRIKGNPKYFLDPSAGSGNIIKRVSDQYHSRIHFSAIEIDEDLQATLRGHGYKVIDNDFLSFSGPDKFDLIIANPPFDEGDLHLLKAINIMYSGQILFYLNAETIRNPYTNTRKELVKKLHELNAEIEFIPDAFLTAERPTKVEVALIDIFIERSVEDDIFAGVDDTIEVKKPTIDNNYEVSTKKTIEELVLEYNQIVKLCTQTIIDYYRNFKKVSKYIGLNKEAEKTCYYYSPSIESKQKSLLTKLMQDTLNNMLVSVRHDFWRRTLELKEVKARMTSKKQEEFEHQVSERCHMDFTENNIRQFVLNIIGSYKKTLTEAVLDIFNKFTIRHCYSNGLYEDNIHYFNGWKTNKAFKVNKKVIIPIYAGYSGGPFYDDIFKKWKLDYNAHPILNDIDKVMNYFDGMNHYYSITAAIEHAFNRGETRKIESTYFTITCYKKGTIHLTFNSDDILRRFNTTACIGKEWLPHDYGSKPYDECTPEIKTVIDDYEGKDSYNKNAGKSLFADKKLVLIAA